MGSALGVGATETLGAGAASTGKEDVTGDEAELAVDGGASLLHAAWRPAGISPIARRYRVRAVLITGARLRGTTFLEERVEAGRDNAPDDGATHGELVRGVEDAVGAQRGGA